SQCVKEVTTVEIDPEIAEVGVYNFSFLALNVNVLNADSVEYLKQLSDDMHFDAIFIDPARRGEGGKRLYGFADCQPDVLSLLPLIKRHCSRLYIKASPMLDVTQSMRELGEALVDVIAVSVKNECKELLFVLDFEESKQSVTFIAMNYDGNEWQRFESDWSCHIGQGALWPNIEDFSFLYEPNASIMKLGCYDAVERDFGVSQIAPSSHLMVSDRLVVEFPGRQFKVIEVIPFKGKEIKLLSKRYSQLNVATRNFRLSAEALKKRLGVQDCGDTYLFGTTLANGEQVLVLCEKIN
ncbi:MAG: SAM-dependent methyltransferase, partial [Muribaculaceae bacterium]|nr:SAM-dependent methyltransferase [Muribaculaceae bacterium]